MPLPGRPPLGGGTTPGVSLSGQGVDGCYRGTSLIRNTHSPRGSPQVPWRRAAVGSYGGKGSYQRGTPLARGACMPPADARGSDAHHLGPDRLQRRAQVHIRPSCANQSGGLLEGYVAHKIAHPRRTLPITRALGNHLGGGHVRERCGPRRSAYSYLEAKMFIDHATLSEESVPPLSAPLKSEGQGRWRGARAWASSPPAATP